MKTEVNEPLENLIDGLCAVIEFLLVETPIGDIPGIASILEAIASFLC